MLAASGLENEIFEIVKVVCARDGRTEASTVAVYGEVVELVNRRILDDFRPSTLIIVEALRDVLASED